MHVDAQRQQIRFSLHGERVTFSCRRALRSGSIDFSALANHVRRLLEARLAGLCPPATSVRFLDRLPRSLRETIASRLVADPSLSLGDRLDAYAASRWEMGTSLASDLAVLRDCELLPRWWVCSTISETALREVLDMVTSEREYSDGTRWRVIKHWRTFFRWLVDQHAIASDPTRGFREVLARRDKAMVRSEWIDAMVAKCDFWVGRFWLRTLQWTGCRLRESLRIRFCDIDRDRQRIIIQDTKRGVLREAPLYRAIDMHLPDRLPQREQTILDGIDEHTCRRWFDRLREQAGVPAWRPRFNSIRATRATQLAADPRVTRTAYQVLLGHSARTAVANYLQLDDSTVRTLIQEAA